MSSKSNNSKKIYIVLTYTGTILSKIIRVYTKKDFSHVSIALDENLEEMYSFGRLNPYNPFRGGFVKEGIDVGTFKRFNKTKSEIYSFKLTDNQYKKIKNVIKKMEKEHKIYKFNYIGLFAVAVNLKYKKDNSFYCAEFVKYLLEIAGIEMNIPEIVKPMDFKKIKNLNLEYDGLLKNYTSKIEKTKK